MARPRVKIDIAELEKLYGMQCTDEEVAAFVGVSTRTLARWREVKKFAEGGWTCDDAHVAVGPASFPDLLID